MRPFGLNTTVVRTDHDGEILSIYSASSFKKEPVPDVLDLDNIVFINNNGDVISGSDIDGLTYRLVLPENTFISSDIGLKIIEGKTRLSVVGYRYLTPGDYVTALELTLFLNYRDDAEEILKKLKKQHHMCNSVLRTMFVNISIPDKNLAFEQHTMARRQIEAKQDLDNLPLYLAKDIKLRDSQGWGWIEVAQDNSIVAFGIGEYGNDLSDKAELDQTTGYIPGALIKEFDGRRVYGCHWSVGVPRASYPLHSPECSEKLRLSVHIGGTVKHQF